MMNARLWKLAAKKWRARALTAEDILEMQLERETRRQAGRLCLEISLHDEIARQEERLREAEYDRWEAEERARKAERAEREAKSYWYPILSVW